MKGICLVHEIRLNLYQGDLEEAIESSQKALEDLERIDGSVRYAEGCFFLGTMLSMMGQMDEAEMLLQKAKTIYDRTGNPIISYAFLIKTYVKGGKSESACQMLDEVRQKMAQSKNPYMIDRLFHHYAEAYPAVAEERWEDAMKAFQAFVEMAQETGYRWWRAWVLWDWAEIRMLRGGESDRDRALEMLAEVKAEYIEMGATGWVERLDKRLGELDNG
jgi:tetratricopeptide (TPR) repeat protein